MERKEHIDTLWNGVDFAAGLPRRPSVPALLLALQSKDLQKIEQACQNIPASLAKSNLITQWLNENFSDHGAEVLWSAGLVNPIPMWSYAMENRLGDQLGWCLSSVDRIQRIFERPGRAGQDSPTPKDWVEDLKILSRLAPDVYLRATEKACWGKLLSYRRHGDPNVLISSWVEAFTQSSISPTFAAKSFSRIFTPQVASEAFRSYHHFDTVAAYAAMLDPLRGQLVRADLKTATRLQELINASPVLGYAWGNYYNEFSGHFHKQAGYSRESVSYHLPLPSWPRQYERFHAQNLLEDLLSQGAPALCSLIIKSPSPEEDPSGISAKVCQAITAKPILGFLFLKNLPSAHAPHVAARLAVWLPNVQVHGLGLAHLAVVAHQTAGMASALARASLSDRLLERKGADGKTPLDLYKVLAQPSEATLDKVLSARVQKVRKSLMKLAPQDPETEKSKPAM